MYPRRSDSNNWWWLGAFGVLIAWLLLDLSIGPIPSPSQLFSNSRSGQVRISDDAGSATQESVPSPGASPSAVTPAASPLPAPSVKPNGVSIVLSRGVMEVTYNGTTTNYGFTGEQIATGTYKITTSFHRLPEGYYIVTPSGRYLVNSYVTLTKDLDINACTAEPGLGMSVSDDTVVILDLKPEQSKLTSNALALSSNTLSALIQAGHLPCGTIISIQ